MGATAGSINVTLTLDSTQYLAELVESQSRTTAASTAISQALSAGSFGARDLAAAMQATGSAGKGLSDSLAIVSEAEAQAAARIKDMVARSLEAAQAMASQASAAQSAAGGIGSLGSSADQVRANVAAQTQAMIDAAQSTRVMNDEMQQLRTTLAQGSTSFAAIGDQYARLDRAMATGKLSLQDYDAALAAVGKDEDARLAKLAALAAKYDPLGAATRKLAADQALLDDAFRSGMISTDDYERTLAGIRVDQASVQLRQLAQQEKDLEAAFRSGAIAIGEYKASMADIAASQKALGAVASSAKSASSEMEGFGLKTAGARREVLVLAHEALTGSWSNFGGSIMVLAERMDLLEGAASGVALQIAAVLAPLVLVGAAMVHVAEQNAQMNEALVMTGGYVGLTTDGLRELAVAATAGGATVDTAVEAVTALAATGRLTGDEIASLGRTVADVATYTSTSAKQMVDDLTKLADDPVKASVKLNEQYHYLTASTYDQITALEKQGDATGAAQVAVEAFSAAMEQRTVDIAKNEGIILAGWRDIKNMISGAVDAIGSFGAAAGPAEVVARLQANKAARFPIGQWDACDEADLQDAIAKQAAAVKAARDKQSQEEQQRQLIDAKSWYDTWNKQFATPAEKRTQEVNEYLDRTAALNLSPEQQLADQQKINDRNKDKTQRKGGTGLVDRAELSGEVQAVKDALADELSAIDSARKVLDASYKSGTLSASQYYQQQRDLLAQAASDQIDAANREAALIAQGIKNRALSASQRAQLANQEKKALADGSKAVEDFFAKVSVSAAQEDEVWDKYGKSQLEAMQKQIDSATQNDQSLKDQIDTFGMTKGAVDALRASRADETLAALEQGRAIAMLNGEVGDTKPWDDAIEKAKSLSKVLHSVADDQSSLDDLEQAKKQQDDLVSGWKSTIDGIGSDFHNGFLQMLTDGTAGWSSWTKALKNTFEATVIDEIYKAFAKPFIVSVIANIAGLTDGTGVQNSVLQSYGLGGNSTVNNLLSNPVGTYNNLSNGYNTIMSWLQGYGGASTALGSAAIAGASSGALGSGGVVLGGLGSGIGSGVASSTASMVGSNAYGFTGSGVGSSLGSSSVGLMYGGAGLLGGLAGGALFGNKGYSSLGGSLGAMGGLAVGTSSAVAGTALGAELGSWAGPIGAVIGAALGALAGSFIGGGETRYGASYVSNGQSATKFAGPSGGDPEADQVTQQINSTFQTIQSMATQLGGSIDGLGQYKASYEISPQKGNSFVAAGFTTGSDWYPDRQDLRGVKDSTTVLNDFSLQLQRSVIDSLQKANLDAPYAAVLQGVDASKLSANDITTLLSELNAVKSLFDSFQHLGSDFDNLKKASTDAQLAVLNLSGGVDSFNTSATYFYQHFTSAGQQADDSAKSVNDQLVALGYSGIHTRDQFRDLVESLDLSTDAGQRTYVALLGLAPAFDNVVSSYESAVASAYSTQSQALQSFKSQVDQFRQSLTTGDLSTLSPEQQYAATKQRFDELYSAAIGGDANAQSNLTSAAQDFLTASKAYNASSGQYQADLSEVMQSMDYASSSADAQLTQLKQMVAGIVDVNDSVQTVAEAIAALQGWTAVNGSHASGLYRVPFDGYIAELHKGERVLTAAEAQSIELPDSGAQTVDLGRYRSRGNDALLQEIRSLRATVEQLRQDRRQADVAHATQRADLAKAQASQLDEQTTLLRDRKRPGK
ncbi:phage tail length tape measure family protein [Paraburkholderia caribensis]|uniref:phage tail length tape measure family protein n=1 Tax=Paraburkholderia caribensis TaxID=75105 RepID=UPI0007225084|nr:phage tail length tape measure family protein [Paraburkholderia caribensis]ALP62824.1 phage tail tape measure protein [Paraburkholderia caribensis]AUT51945.1 phage tail tape measure protein [Paraburkholderia caribensis]